MRRPRGLLYVAGLALGCGAASFLFAFTPRTAAGSEPTPKPAPAEPAAEARPEPADPAALTAIARRDPMELVRRGEQWYRANVQEYRCTLVKQERLGDKLTEVQEIELRYRENPRAIYMLWKKNADQARRALLLDTDPEYVDKHGRKLARVEPNGAVVRLFCRDAFVEARGSDAQKSSRRFIDEAGLRATIDLLRSYNALAEERGVLNLRFGGLGEIDGRPTFVILRDLPYTGPDGPYPDAHMILHLDQRNLLPIAVYSYADHDAKTLLGSYVFRDIDFDPHFTSDDFRF